jgi:hypothetical protein
MLPCWVFLLVGVVFSVQLYVDWVLHMVSYWREPSIVCALGLGCRKVV